MAKKVYLSEEQFKFIVESKKYKTVTQLGLFGDDRVEVMKPNKRQKTEAEKEEEREQRRIKKQKEADRKFDEYWAQFGIHQGELFPDEK